MFDRLEARSVLYTRENAFEPMLTAVPSFRPEWNAFVEEWANGADAEGDEELAEEDDGLPLFLAMGDLIRHIADLVPDHNAALVAALDVCERWMTNGDEYVVNLANVGFIETLTNGNVGGRLISSDTYAMLPARCRESWDYFVQFWGDTEADFGRVFDAEEFRERAAVLERLKAKRSLGLVSPPTFEGVEDATGIICVEGPLQQDDEGE